MVVMVVTLLGCYYCSCGCGCGKVGGMGACDGDGEVVHATAGCIATWRVQ